MARDLMTHYGLREWAFKWNNRMTQFGVCVHSRHTLAFSRPLASVRTEEDMLNTITHEIAHAVLGPWHDHDEVWRLKAIELGSDGEARHELPQSADILYKHEYKCRDCVFVYKSFRRLSHVSLRRHMACKAMGKEGRLIYKEITKGASIV